MGLPGLAAVATAEHLPVIGGAVHPAGMPLVKGDAEHSAAGLEAQVHLLPVQTAVNAAEQHPLIAAEGWPGGHPDSLGVAWRLTNEAAVGLSLLVQRPQGHVGPVVAPVGA